MNERISEDLPKVSKSLLNMNTCRLILLAAIIYCFAGIAPGYASSNERGETVLGRALVAEHDHDHEHESVETEGSGETEHPGAHDDTNCPVLVEYLGQPWRKPEPAVKFLLTKSAKILVFIIICYIYLKRVHIRMFLRKLRVGSRT